MTDLFQQIDALFRHQKPEGSVPSFVLHRFLASEQILAPAAKQFALDLQDDDLIAGIWMCALPQGRAPRLRYAAPKKPPGAEHLAQRVQAVEVIGRSEAEAWVEIWGSAGLTAAACAHYGCEQEEQ